MHRPYMQLTRATTRNCPTRTLNMALNTRIWMTGALDWFALIDGEEVFLGRREVPAPLDEGDAWTNEYGDMFKVIDSEIRLVGKTEPPKKYW
jgi:hypothetical protein